MRLRSVVVNLAWLAAYGVMLAVVVMTVLQTRERLLHELDTPQARQDWEQWRAEARRQADGEGPVKRRVPASAEPPTLVLMRDHFAVCMTAAVVFSSLLFVVFMITFRGTFSRPQTK